MWQVRELARELIPRFVTEYVTAFSDEVGILQPFCLADKHCVIEDGVPDGVIQVWSIAWLGIGVTYMQSDTVLSWDEYQAEKGSAV